MEATALKVVKTDEVEGRALSIVDQAKAVTVTDAETYTAAGALWKQIGEMIKEVKDAFDPICEAANRAHKAATAKRASFLDPLTAAQKSVKGLMEAWDAEQERLRKAEEARLEAERKAEEERLRKIELDKIEADRKAEEERLLEAAAAAEKAGNTEKAEELTAQAIETTERAQQETSFVASAPLATVPVKVQKDVPKIVGGPVFREVWSAKVTSIRDLCRSIGAGTTSEECVIGLDRDKSGVISSPALNRMATALKGTMSVPGVRPVSRRV